MKRLFIVFSVIISSFFLFKEDVNAEEITVTYEDYSLVESDSFRAVYNSAIEVAETNNYLYYVILQSVSSLDYYVFFSNYSSGPSIGSNSGTSFSNAYYFIRCSYIVVKRYNSSGVYIEDAYVASASSEGLELKRFYRSDYDLVNTYHFLYSNKDVLFSYNHYAMVINFPDITYTFDSSSNRKIFPNLYSVYLTYGNIEVPDIDIHKEEKEKIASFYTICIEKIGYLANQISNNYIYLSMITIFILIFVIELIRRYLM